MLSKDNKESQYSLVEVGGWSQGAEIVIGKGTNALCRKGGMAMHQSSHNKTDITGSYPKSTIR